MAKTNHFGTGSHRYNVLHIAKIWLEECQDTSAKDTPTIKLFIVHHVVQIKVLYEFILSNSIAIRGLIPLANL